MTINIGGFTWIHSEAYCENGQLMKRFNPNASEPELVKEYLCDGTLVLEYYKSKKGFRGLYKSYHNNGKPAEQGNYEKKSSPLGEQKAGLWESFNLKGKKYHEEFYENGVVVRENKF